MLVKGTPIQCRRDGQCKPVEDLLMGDHIYDPRADCSAKIVIILSRKIRMTDWDRSARASLWPLRISPGAIGPDMPRQVSYVSPGQMIYSVSSGSGPSILECQSARELARQSSDIQPCVVHEVEYFAIFTQHLQTLSVNGLLLQSFSHETLDLNDDQLALINQIGRRPPEAMQ